MSFLDVVSVLLLTSLFSSCCHESNIDLNVDSPEFNTCQAEYSATIANRIIDKEPWAAASVEEKKIDNNRIQIYATIANSKKPAFVQEAIGFSKLPFAKGVYPIKSTGLDDNLSAFYKYSPNGQDAAIFITDTTNVDNFIQIEEINSTAKTIKGRFNLTLVSFTDTVKFSNGRFNIKF